MSEFRLGDYNRGGMIAFMGSMAFTIVFFIYIAFLHPGVDLKEIQVPTEQTKEAPVEQQPPADAPAAEAAPAAAQPEAEKK